MPRDWHAPGWFLRDASCLHEHEGAWPDLTGNGYAGGLQFTAYTWQSVGGAVERDRYGNITHWADIASPREQIYRCWLVYLRDGRSFREWGTAGMCGLY